MIVPYLWISHDYSSDMSLIKIKLELIKIEIKIKMTLIVSNWGSSSWSSKIQNILMKKDFLEAYINNYITLRHFPDFAWRGVGGLLIVTPPCFRLI